MINKNITITKEEQASFLKKTVEYWGENMKDFISLWWDKKNKKIVFTEHYKNEEDTNYLKKKPWRYTLIESISWEDVIDLYSLYEDNLTLDILIKKLCLTDFIVDLTEEKQITIINLTPHDINIVGENGEEIAKFESKGIARCSEENAIEGKLNNIPVSKTSYGNIKELPDEDEEGNTFYIVSRLIRQTLYNRTDLLVPGQLVRDEEGKVIGCKSLSIN